MFVIAGVTGHVGGVAARELLAQKQQVKVIVRDQAKGKDWAARGAEVAVGTLDDREFLATALKGAKGLFTLLPPNYASKDFYAEQRRTADSLVATLATKAGMIHARGGTGRRTRLDPRFPREQTGHRSRRIRPSEDHLRATCRATASFEPKRCGSRFTGCSARPGVRHRCARFLRTCPCVPCLTPGRG